MTSLKVWLSNHHPKIPIQVTVTFSSKKNVEFEIYHFHLASQNTDETTDAYHARLRTLSKFCSTVTFQTKVYARWRLVDTSHAKFHLIYDYNSFFYFVRPFWSRSVSCAI